jgi:hypothetical protein
MHHLHIGRRKTDVSLRPDPVWPRMWRVHDGDRVSDMVNISRAKDAAISWARPRGLGAGEVVHWHRREQPANGGSRASELRRDRRAPVTLLKARVCDHLFARGRELAHHKGRNNSGLFPCLTPRLPEPCNHAPARPIVTLSPRAFRHLVTAPRTPPTDARDGTGYGPNNAQGADVPHRFPYADCMGR